MKRWFCKIFTPWRAAAEFDDTKAYFSYLVRYDKRCNTLRVLLFVVALAMLMAGYALTDTVSYAHPWYTIAIAALVPALLITLLIEQNEKQLPRELQQK